MTSANGLIKLGFTPEIDFSLQDDGDGTYIRSWMSGSPQPSEAEIETAHSEWQAEYDSQEYARLRKPEYPSINELVVGLWEATVEDRPEASIALEIKRQQIKIKYPKP